MLSNYSATIITGNTLEDFENKWRSDTEKSTRECMPSYYINSNPKRFPAEMRCAIERWLREDQRWGRGLGFIGETGVCKTRGLYCALQKALTTPPKILRKSLGGDGKGTGYYSSVDTFAVVTGSEFTKLVLRSQNFSDETGSTSDLNFLHRVGFLVLDDLGTGRLTDTVLEELYGLIEYRTREAFPILFSSNFVGNELVERAANPKAMAAILRRLVEFCDVVTISNQPTPLT